MRKKRHDKFISIWQNNILEYLTSDAEPEEIISLIKKSNYSNLISYLASFVVNLKGDDLNQLKKLITEKKLRTYFIKHLKSFRKKKQIEAIYFLRFVRSENAVGLITDKLTDPNISIFRTAVESLAYMNAIDMIDLILDAAKSRKDITTESILSIIIKFDRSICASLIKRLAKEQSTEIQQVIITVLWHFKYAEAIDVVLKILIYSGNKNLILESIKYLGEIENLDSINTLRFFLSHSKPEIRAAAIRAISQIGDTSLEDKIIEMIHDNNIEVKIAAAHAMYNGSHNAKSKLSEIAWTSKDKEEATVTNRIILEKRILENV